MAEDSKAFWAPQAIGALVLAIVMMNGASKAASDAPPDVVVHQLPTGTVLVDAKGRALYIYDRDIDPTKSNCIGKCEETWPPLLAPENSKSGGDWSTLVRANGKLQWVYKGKPLYTYVKDDTPEAAYGDGVGKLWHLAADPLATPPGLAIGKTLRGDALTDSHGRTLYTFETAGRERCTGSCLRLWEPIRAPWTAIGWGDWSALDMGGGVRQWAFKGKPLYRYARDAQPGDVRGEGTSDHWHVASLGPPPPVPAFVTVQPSDFGPVLANAEGKTLYVIFRDLERIKKETCNEACLTTHWRQLSAPEGTKPTGQWSLRAEDGALHWTFKGLPIYIYLDDARPGDTGGFRFAVGNGVRRYGVVTAPAVLPHRSSVVTPELHVAEFAISTHVPH